MAKIELLHSEWESAKADFLKLKEDRPYYDEKKDSEIRDEYYRSISFTDTNLFESLQTLL